MVTMENRALRYLQKLPLSIQGQGGSDVCFKAACRLAHKFGLDRKASLAVLAEWNKTHCQPPWSAKELAHKVDSALKSKPPTGKGRWNPIPTQPPPVTAVWSHLPPDASCFEAVQPAPSICDAASTPNIVVWSTLAEIAATDATETVGQPDIIAAPTTADAKPGVQREAQAQAPLF